MWETIGIEFEKYRVCVIKYLKHSLSIPTANPLQLLPHAKRLRDCRRGLHLLPLTTVLCTELPTLHRLLQRVVVLRQLLDDVDLVLVDRGSTAQDLWGGGGVSGRK